ncbi:AAA family ATPase [Corynebacterium propinquum]|uniref:AAA family ATPase n=1 Tax=Corynebacterium propinquum TaxID=43769 RepID=UPI00266EC5AC|nr:AAA family ATPase [Corynebacterium propinquum]WKS32322.1 AAA family ATPase [Corynebacterium propinquum]WKS36855.1 AAA family ATPase [Corynebacterium propinquum]WKS38834.1 AAA family ATPase [Corynebacterium propinquum]WKS42153.1 AAA family ATPase [Corynebacterium propinquum]WKS46400.1 AAA family ATPase [Corynebacterium propinquum]
MLTTEKQKQAPVFFDDSTGELTNAGVASLAKHRLQAKTLAELANEPENPARFFLIPGLVSSSLTYLYGQSKVGKSFVVANVVASVLDGKPFLGRKPLKTVDGVVIVTTDAGDGYAYRQRLNDLGVADDDRVLLVPVGIAPEPERLAEVADLFVNGDYGFAVFDHATGLVPADQNINVREPWVNLWRFLDSLGVPVVLVGHSSDSKFEGKPIHRPAGNSAATQLARTRVEVHRPDERNRSNPLRELVVLNNYGEDERVQVKLAPEGLTLVDDSDDKPEAGRHRDSQALDNNAVIARRAVELKQPTVKATAEALHAEGLGSSVGSLTKRILPALVKSGLLVRSSDPRAKGCYEAGDKLRM